MSNSVSNQTPHPAPNADPNEIAEDLYFSANPAPKTLDQHVVLAREFINQHATAKHRVVLITSGGTTVPLEKQTVRDLSGSKLLY